MQQITIKDGFSEDLNQFLDFLLENALTNENETFQRIVTHRQLLYYTIHCSRMRSNR